MKLLSVLPLAGLAAVLRRGRAEGRADAAAIQNQVGTGGGLPRAYSPSHVGNDASARPWERVEPLAGAEGGARRPMQTASPGVPEGFDAVGFLEVSKAHFVELQAAWNRADMASLRAMMTTEMLDQIQVQLVERERQAEAADRQTEVVMLDAQLLGVEESPAGRLASVEFSGLSREEASAGPSPFREVWSISCPTHGAQGWLVAGVQALQ